MKKKSVSIGIGVKNKIQHHAKKSFLKIILITAITVCTVCMLVKSFMAIRYKSEMDGGEMTLEFKANPLAHNLIFEDKGESYLLWKVFRIKVFNSYRYVNFYLKRNTNNDRKPETSLTFKIVENQKHILRRLFV